MIDDYFNQSDSFLFQDLLDESKSMNDNGVVTQDNLVADCLDHMYFLEEIK